MKVCIAGSRTIEDFGAVDKAVRESGFAITEVVSGGALGVDRLGEIWAKSNGIPIKQFLPDWNIGKQAGMIRNAKMAEYADALIAVWDGESRGTLNCIGEFRSWNKPVFIGRS